MRHSKHQIFRHQIGISLVEVLVAMVISLFLLAGIVQVYLANSASYSFTNAVSRVQENARYAMDIMAQDLRMAGFFGCAVYDPEDPAAMDLLVNNLNTAGPGYDPELHDFLSQPLVEGTENDGLNGSDSITLRGTSPGNVTVLPPYMSTSAVVFVTQPHGLQADDIVMISNCRGGDIFQVTNINPMNGTVVHNTGAGSPGNYNPDNCQGGNAHCFSQTYGADASLFRMQATTYTIAAGESGEPALWRSVNGVNQELVDGIEQMQLLYGVDTTDDDHPNQYMTSDLITDVVTAPNNWNDVMSIRLMLLVRSANDGVVEAPQVVNYNGATAAAADQRLRQVFTTTIALRNRVSDT
jgi:type IV pilus assembly protein PilW